jgi:hypothetical protein
VLVLPKSLAVTIKTRLKITSVLTRVQKAISICTPGSKSQCNVLLIAGKACNKLPAYGRKKACIPAGLWPVFKTVIYLQGCRARLPGKAAGQDCRARLPGKAAWQGCNMHHYHGKSLDLSGQ